MRELEGKVVIVTGGGKAKSIGYGVARACAAAGANVVVTGPSKGRVNGAKELEAEFGVRVLPIKVEHADAASVEAAVARVAEEFGRVDALVTCAQAAKSGSPVTQIKASELEAAFAAGPLAVQTWIKACHKLLKESGGSVVNFVPAVNAEPGMAALAVVKESVRALSTVASREWERDDINVYAVEALAQTAQLDRVAEQFPDAYARVVANIPEGSFADPELIGIYTVALLQGTIPNDSRFVTN